MAPARTKQAPISKTKTAARTTNTPTTKPKTGNRVAKASTTKRTYNDKGVESRRAKDSKLLDKSSTDNKRCEKLLARGPIGPPVYDTQGFELDYAKIRKYKRPISKSSRGSTSYMKMIERESAERSEIEKIVGLSGNDFRASVRSAVQDRVARDLDVPWHTIQLEQYREWKRLGFKIDPEEFKMENISEEEKKRLEELASGSAFRK